MKTQRKYFLVPAWIALEYIGVGHAASDRLLSTSALEYSGTLSVTVIGWKSTSSAKNEWRWGCSGGH